MPKRDPEAAAKRAQGLCSEKDCPKPLHKNYPWCHDHCKAHWREHQKNWKARNPGKRSYTPRSTTCTVRGCNEPKYKTYWRCEAHQKAFWSTASKKKNASKQKIK